MSPLFLIPFFNSSPFLSLLYHPKFIHSCARESINEEPSDKGYRLLGEVFLSLNKRKEALAAFDKSLELNPKQEYCLKKG